MKSVLDACCGGKMFWFDKSNPDTLYMDIRKERHILCDGRKFVVSPDIVSDFKNIPYPDETINIEFGKKSWYSCELPLEAANAVFDKIVSKTEGFYRPSKTNDYDGLSTTLLFPNKIIKAVLRERQDKQIKYSFETGV